MSKSTKQKLYVVRALASAMPDTVAEVALLAFARNLEEGILHRKGAKKARKLEKSRGRFPWPDVEKMTLSARQELAEVMFKNGHYAAGKALSPNTDVGYLAGARPIMKTFDPEVEKIGRVHEAIQRAKESLEAQHRQEDNKADLLAPLPSDPASGEK